MMGFALLNPSYTAGAIVVGWAEQRETHPCRENPPMARLSVNLNKVALLRNARHTGVPDLLKFGRIAHDAGADGLTVHPRPDERHIRRSDVPAIAQLMQPWRPACELNIEGYPDERLFEIVPEV